MVGFHLYADDLRLCLRNPSEPTRSINRSKYQRCADTLRSGTIDCGDYFDDPHPVEGPNGPLGQGCYRIEYRHGGDAFEGAGQGRGRMTGIRR